MSASPALPLPGPFNTPILPLLVSQSVEHWLNTHTNGVIASQLWCRDQGRRKTMTCHHKEGPVRTTAQEHRDGKSGFKSSHKGWGDGQLAKFLLYKHKILSSIPRTIKNAQGWREPESRLGHKDHCFSCRGSESVSWRLHRKLTTTQGDPSPPISVGACACVHIPTQKNTHTV